MDASRAARLTLPSALTISGQRNWQFDCVAGACKAAGGQFHDAHAIPYSETVLSNLSKITIALHAHLDVCKDVRI